MCIRTVTFVCRQGHYYSEQPPPGIQSNAGWCHPCSDGSFMDSGEHNERHCRPCRKCNGAPNEFYKRQCDKMADSECAFCPAGQLAAPDGGCQSPTTKSLADPTTTSASTTNAKTTAKTTTTASATSSETRDALTSNDSTHSEWSRVSQAATKSSGSDGGFVLLRSSQWNAYNKKNGSASQEDDDSSSFENIARASSTVVVDDSLEAGTPFTVTGDDIPLDARVTALAVTSVTSTVLLVALVAFWLKRRDKERHGGGSRAKLSCCSCTLSPHVYQEPCEYDAAYLEPPPYQSDSGRSSISAASYGGSHTYEDVRPYGSFRPDGNFSKNSLLLNGTRGDPGERLLCPLSVSDSEILHASQTSGALRHSSAAFSQAPQSEVKH